MTTRMKKKTAKASTRKTRTIPQKVILSALAFLTFIGDVIRSIPNLLVSVCTRTGSFLLSIPIKKHVLKMKYVVRVLHDIGQLVLSFFTPFFLFLRKKIVQLTKQFINLPRLDRNWRFPLPSFPKLSLSSVVSKQKGTPYRSAVIYRKPKLSRLTNPVFWQRVKFFLFGIGVTMLFFFIPYLVYQWLDGLPNPKLLTT